MKKFYSLSTSKKTLLIAISLLVVALCASAFCFFVGYSDIPLGIALGGTSSIIPYILFSYKEDRMSYRRSMRFTIFVIILMSVLHILALVIAAILTYVVKVNIFNIFATFGAIFIGLIANIITHVIEGRRNNG